MTEAEEEALARNFNLLPLVLTRAFVDAESGLDVVPGVGVGSVSALRYLADT